MLKLTDEFVKYTQDVSHAASNITTRSQLMEGGRQDCGLTSNSHHEKDPQETESEDDEQLNDLNMANSRKRRQRDEAEHAPNGVESRANEAQRSNSNHTESHKSVTAYPGSPAPTNRRISTTQAARRTPEGSLRRSSRKKRKTSHYSPLLDVGHATSDDGRS